MTTNGGAGRPLGHGWPVVLASTLLVSACGASGQPAQPSSTTAGGQAASVTVSDAWVKAADTGMTAGFAVLTNTGTADAVVAGVTSPASRRIQLHETVKDAAGTVMKARPDGLAVPAGATVTLSPGGDHVMFLDLAAPLRSGTGTTFTLRFADGSTLPVSAQVRSFSAANESYSPATGAPSTGAHG